MLIKLENGAPVGYPVVNENFYMLYPNVSFPNPLTTDAIEPYGFGLYEYSQIPTSTTYEKVIEVTPVKNEAGIWMQTWEVVPMQPEEVAEKNKELRNTNKAQAESLLSATDWTATVDINNPQYSNPYLGNQDAFLAYRSAVRKIAINPPISVDVWPVKPDEIWITT